MKNRNNILVINPGSTSTKIAIFVNNQLHKKAEFIHDSSNQLDYRYNLIKRWVEKRFNLKDIDAMVSRGGLLKPLKSGVYKINKRIVTDLYSAKYGEHASNLGALIADKFSKLLKVPAFIVDPVTVDELIPEARITGLASIKRKSIFHALNQKAVAKRFAKKIKKPYRRLNLIVAHLGGGITIGAHKAGKVVEVNNGLEEGPFTPERAGNLPIAELIKLCYSGRYSKDEMIKNVIGQGGMVSLLRTNDCGKIEVKIKKGNKKAKLIYQAMAYNISKFIGAMAVVLKGKVEAIILTGSLARSKMLVKLINPQVKFIAPIHVYPGEDEMTALAEGALRAISGKERIRKY